MRTPTKHSTNVETASSVVPVPNVVSRSPLTSTTPETMLSTTIRNSPVRLLLNSTATISDTLISVQPQFTLFPPMKISSEQTPDRSVVINSGTNAPKKMEIDSRSGIVDKKSPHFNPITVFTPTKISSPQIMPLMQNAELRTSTRPALSGGTPLSSVITTTTNTNAKVLPIAVSVDAVSRASPNLLTTLRPVKSESPISPLATVQAGATSQAMTDPIASSSTQFLKAASLVSNSAVPTLSIETNQTASLVSVVPVESARNVQASPSVATAIRPSSRVPIAMTPNRPTTTNLTLTRPTLGCQPVIAPVSPLNSSHCPLTPSRKRSRKQQLLAPTETENTAASIASNMESDGVNLVEVVTSQNDDCVSNPSIPKVPSNSTTNSAVATATTSTSNIEAALQSSIPSSVLPIVTVASSVSSGSGQVLNLRFLQVRTTTNSNQSGKEAASHFGQVSISAATPIVASQFHSLVVSSSPNTSLEEGQTSSVSASIPTTTASIAASLVTASSFHSVNVSSHQSMYVFPTTAVSTPLRATPSGTTSGNVLQVRFRAPTPTKPPLSNASTQQTVRAVLSQPVTNTTVHSGIHVTLQPALAPPSPLRKTPSVDWLTSKPNSPLKHTPQFSPTSATPEESNRKVSSTSVNTITKATPIDSSGQPTVPILRVADPNSRNCFESLNNKSMTVSPCKRSRKQSNSLSGIKKQCTWELRTDPMDSNRSVWRSPLDRADQQLVSHSFQESEGPGTVTKRRIESISPDSTIHGRPNRMQLYKSSHLPSRFSGLWKGSKTGHFLRSSEVRQRQEGPHPHLSSHFRPRPSTISKQHLELGLRRRRQRAEIQYEQSEISEVGSSSKNPDLITLGDLLELRNQQAETGFVNHPVDTTSPLDLNCWRIFLCLKNCEKLIGVECEKLSVLSRAFERIFQNRFEGCNNQEARGKEVSASMRDLIIDQQQELITRLFLQAIPPASPSIPESRTVEQEERGRKMELDYDNKTLRPLRTETDTRVIEERAMGLLQRVQALMDGLQRVSKLSHELITGHRDPVISFVDDLEFMQRNASTRSSSRSSCSPHRQDEGSCNSGIGSSSGDTGDENEIDVRLGLKPSGFVSVRGALPPSTPGSGRRRSTSPIVLKGSTTRNSSQNGRRR